MTVQTTETVPATLLRRVAVPLGLLGGVAAAFAYVGTVDPNQPGHYPACPLLQVAGIYCPGCGGLRGAHALVHGDLATALGANALAVVGYALFAVGWTVWTVRSARGRPPGLRLGRTHLWALGAVVLVFTVVRNLPFGGFLQP
ncbi:DUF2752 domain-containing protein [Streptomyces sp. VRA16 Mangrove soil]|uniref:DUF2752 domain-containing protein n=1 Tax=Streptomyces sp. VRA16 Mangrove soil TaxID=2817434 RepID=UPI001A9DCFAD|nr:DUF2752 domain-containing protein [Streptomyces sp. VRA16 Mangrove soil]MBO1333465.1 DUF2752 domain-containing protein [Streptomyces sp. VRA16 Mangrove soil]